VSTNRRILLVDDEPNVLDAYRRTLRKGFEVVTALGAALALDAVKAQPAFAVVVADMRMPQMTGVELLGELRRIAPQTVRMMLTGNADQQTAVDAINRGEIFRFLNKPCPTDQLTAALEAGIEQYRLITAEQELLQKTLRGSVKVLIDTLALVEPEAFGRAMNVRDRVRKLFEPLNVDTTWPIDIAAMLAPLPLLTLPDDLRRRLTHGGELSDTEREVFAQAHASSHHLIANIPRLEAVAHIILYLDKHYDGAGPPEDRTAGDDLPLGARLIAPVRDLVNLEAAGKDFQHAVAILRERHGWYDPKVIDQITAHLSPPPSGKPICVRIRDVLVGQTLAEAVVTRKGMLLLGKDHVITEAAKNRLRSFWVLDQIPEVVTIYDAPPVPV
jgi:response regulator RpfG family c-di-GMP phosphodiesterase